MQCQRLCVGMRAATENRATRSSSIRRSPSNVTREFITGVVGVLTSLERPLHNHVCSDQGELFLLTECHASFAGFKHTHAPLQGELNHSEGDDRMTEQEFRNAVEALLARPVDDLSPDGKAVVVRSVSVSPMPLRIGCRPNCRANS